MIFFSPFQNCRQDLHTIHLSQLNQIYNINFFTHINNIEESSKFTVEYEKKDKLPFLSMLIMKKKAGVLTTKIYKKDTYQTVI